MKKNFSLIEIVVGIAIFSLIMLTVMISTNSIIQTRNKVSYNKNQLNAYKQLDNIFNNCVRNAIPFHWNNKNNAKTSIFQGKNNNVTFAYQHRIHSVNEGGIRFISLYLENNQLMAKYNKTPILWWDEQTKGKTESLIENISSISFLYAEKNDDGEIVLLEEWDEEKSEIPLAIQIEVTWENGISKRWLKRTSEIQNL